ncbi:hypothetical protein [Streptomyces sp. NPDC055210]
MTAQIMARPRPGTADTNAADRQRGQRLLDVVRRQDAAVPHVRRAPRTVAEMRVRLAERLADDACGVCGFWRCRCGGQSTRSTGTEATR